MDDISRAVGTTTIINYVNDLISKFKETDITGYADKQNGTIKSGLNEIVDGVLSGGNSIAGAIEAGANGVYKISQKSTFADTHLKEALSYLINAMPNDYRRTLEAKAVVEGFDPDAMLLTMVTANTPRSIVSD